MYMFQWKQMFAERFRLRRNWLNGYCNVRTFEGHMQGEFGCMPYNKKWFFHCLVSALLSSVSPITWKTHRFNYFTLNSNAYVQKHSVLLT